MDQLVSEDHTKTTSILHWIQVDIIFVFFFFVKILFIQFLEWEANIFVSFLKTTLWWWHGCRYLYVMLLKGSLMYLIFTGFVNSHVSNYRDDLRKNKKILFQRFSIFYLYSIKIGSNGKLNRRQGRVDSAGVWQTFWRQDVQHREIFSRWHRVRLVMVKGHF